MPSGREDNKVKAHKEHDRDVISIDWLVACDRQKRRVPLRPRYYIHMSRANLIVSSVPCLLCAASFSPPDSWLLFQVMLPTGFEL